MATYYVATNGNNTNNGSSGSPWQTIGHAMAAGRNLQPGDTVIVRPGTYNTTSPLRPSASGAPDAYITFKSEEKWGAKIVSTANTGIDIFSKTYIRIDGFDVTAGNGGITANYGHHIEVINCHVHDVNKNGIYLGRGEYWIVEGNVVHHTTMDGTANNALTIHLMQNTTVDTTTPGFRCIVRGNIFYENGTAKSSTDSGGIMMDQDPNNPALTWTPDPYDFPRLVENNLCYRNGGPGIIVLAASEPPSNSHISTRSDVLIRCNTCWENGIKPEAGDMVASIICRASGTKWINNVAVVSKASNAKVRAIAITSLPKHPIVFSDIVWLNNATFNGVAGEASVHSNNGGNNDHLLPANGVNGNKLGVDPRFVDSGARDFRPGNGSPLVDAGTSASSGKPETDLTGAARTGVPDIGAYEKVDASTGTMSPNSLVAAAVYVRTASAGIAAVALGGDFVQRSARDTPAPSVWIGDTGAARLSSFAAVTKTIPTETLGAIAVTFSMKPEA